MTANFLCIYLFIMCLRDQPIICACASQTKETCFPCSQQEGAQSSRNRIASTLHNGLMGWSRIIYWSPPPYILYLFGRGVGELGHSWDIIFKYKIFVLNKFYSSHFCLVNRSLKIDLLY